MKIKKQKNKKTTIIIIITISLVVAIVIGFVIFKHIKDSQESRSEAETIALRSSSDEQQFEDLQNNPEKKNTAPNTDQPAPTTTDETTGKKQVQMVSSYDIDGDTIYIRGGINNSVEYDGECYASLIGPGGEAIKKTTVLLQNAATTDCKTIQIKSSELAKGSWSYTLRYSSDTVEGASNENIFEIR